MPIASVYEDRQLRGRKGDINLAGEPRYRLDVLPKSKA
jgi:hypothetical protein